MVKIGLFPREDWVEFQNISFSRSKMSKTFRFFLFNAYLKYNSNGCRDKSRKTTNPKTCVERFAVQNNRIALLYLVEQQFEGKSLEN